MELTILIIESLSNFILIALLVRSELKIIKGKKMLLEQRKREQELEKEFRESPLYNQKVGRVKRENEEKNNSILEEILKSNNYIQDLEKSFTSLKNRLPIKELEEEIKYDENFFTKKKLEKIKALETLAMCMGITVDELKKIRNFDLLPSDRIRRIIDVYLMKPDIDFAISYSVSETEVEWARTQVFAEKYDLKSIKKKNELRCCKSTCFMYNKNSDNNCMSDDFINCQDFKSQGEL